MTSRCVRVHGVRQLAYERAHAQDIQRQLAAAPGASDKDLWWAQIFDQPGPQMGTAACAQQRESCVTGTEAATLVGVNPWSSRDAAADRFTDVREWLLARKTGAVRRDNAPNANMQRGLDEEQEAGELFEALTGLELSKTPIGFIRHPDGLVGASPDRRCQWVPLLIEIKSKRDAFKFIPEINYWWQVQQQMYVTGVHNCVLLQYISSKAFAGTTLPAVCMHLIPFNESAFDAYLRDYAAPFAIDLALRRGLPPPEAALALTDPSAARAAASASAAARSTARGGAVHTGAASAAAAAAARAYDEVMQRANVQGLAAFAPNTSVASARAQPVVAPKASAPTGMAWWAHGRESATARAIAEAALAAAGGLSGVEAAAAAAAPPKPRAPTKKRAPAGSAYAGIPAGAHFNGQPIPKKPRKPRTPKALPQPEQSPQQPPPPPPPQQTPAAAAAAAYYAAVAAATAAASTTAPPPRAARAAPAPAAGVRAIPKTPKALARRRAETEAQQRMQAGVAAMQAAMILFAPASAAAAAAAPAPVSPLPVAAAARPRKRKDASAARS